MIHIVSDTTSGLPADLEGRDGIAVVPQVVIFGEESFLEGLEMDGDTFLRRLQAARELPKTSAPPPGLFSELFERLARPGDTVLCIHPSTEISGTVRSALTARDQFPDADIRVLDTRTIAAPLASLARLAAAWAAEGSSADTIMARLQALSARARIYFVVDTLEYLQKGGRIGGASAFIGGLLRVKPILELRDGRVEPLERERTQKRALARLQALVLDSAARGEESHLAVVHAAAPEAANALAGDLRQALGVAEAAVMDLPPAIVVHTGPGTLGAGFFAPAAGGGGTAMG